jgi:hypothetical protein
MDIILDLECAGLDIYYYFGFDLMKRLLIEILTFLVERKKRD